MSFSIPDLSQLKSLRANLSLSQKDLATRAGVSQSMIAKIEAGRLDPSLSNAQRIASALQRHVPAEQTVKSVMSRHVLSFSPLTSVCEAVKVMKKKGISQVPIVQGALVVGRVTESVILDNVDRIASATLGDIMLPPPPMVDVSAPLSAIVPLLQAYSSVLVMQSGRIVGIVTKADVMGVALRKGL